MRHAHSSAAAAAAAAADPLRALKLKCARQQLLRAQTARATAAATAATAAGSRRSGDTRSDSGSDNGNDIRHISSNSTQREVAALASQLKEVQSQRSAALTVKAAAEVRCERAEADHAQVIALC
jgi:hypothetical protein